MLSARTAAAACPRLLAVRALSTSVPTTEPYPGVADAFQKAPASFPTEISTLSNGVRVATQNCSGHSGTLGVFLDAGSRYETIGNIGAAQFLQKAAFKATTNRSHFKMTRDIETLGGGVAASVTRDVLTYAGDALPESAPALLELMADSIQNPRLMDQDVNAIKEAMKEQSQAHVADSAALVHDALHQAAFGLEGLGNTVCVSAADAANLSAVVVGDFLSQRLRGGNLVVAGHGVEHAALAEAAEKYLSGVPSGKAAASTPAQYFGGEERVAVAPSDGQDERLGVAKGQTITHVAIGFKGVSWSHPDLIATCVLNTLLGGGESFSQGGPGKGMLSRLYNNVLARHPYVISAAAGSLSYDDVGLFCLTGACESSGAAQLVQILASEITAVANGVSADELNRAKNQTRSSLLSNLEHRSIVTDDIGRQVLTWDKRVDQNQFLEDIEKVTAQDVSRVAQEMFNSNVSFAAAGPVHGLRYDQIQGFFK